MSTPTPPAPPPYRNDPGSARVIGPDVEVFYNQDSEADRWVPALNAAHAAGVQTLKAENEALRGALEWIADHPSRGCSASADVARAALAKAGGQ